MQCECKAFLPLSLRQVLARQRLQSYRNSHANSRNHMHATRAPGVSPLAGPSSLKPMSAAKLKVSLSPKPNTSIQKPQQAGF